MKKIGILGFGEIGKAISSLYNQEVKIKDLNIDGDLSNLDLIHVCIPFDENFIGVVVNFLNENDPKYCVIHSTVAPKTIQAINKQTDDKFKVSHCPVRGVHPNLLDGLLTFETFWGCDFEIPELENHLKNLKLKINKVTSVTSEVSKLLDTTYYGLCIAWHGEVKKICDQLGLSFDEVSTKYNETYNDGYTKIGKKNVTRPVLYPTEKIGGHCVIENTEILIKHFESLAFDLILKYK